MEPRGGPNPAIEPRETTPSTAGGVGVAAPGPRPKRRSNLAWTVACALLAVLVLAPSCFPTTHPTLAKDVSPNGVSLASSPALSAEMNSYHGGTQPTNPNKEEAHHANT